MCIFCTCFDCVVVFVATGSATSTQGQRRCLNSCSRHMHKLKRCVIQTAHLSQSGMKKLLAESKIIIVKVILSVFAVLFAESANLMWALYLVRARGLVVLSIMLTKSTVYS